ncbi:MAG: MucBP domain-containing protein [Lachnospiraceae bacterium]|nr:MucBP domain-containing protein [Lachnospiraceae bacterium]
MNNGGAGSNIIIYGGSVTAKSNATGGGAGIGGGASEAGNGGAGSNIEIYGGSVNATGGSRGAGIGGAGGGTSRGAGIGTNITISSGEVTAVGGRYAAGIGGGGGFIFTSSWSDQPNTYIGGAGTNISITGGIVDAKGGTGNSSGQYAGDPIGNGGNASDTADVTKTAGIIFENGVGKVHGTVTLDGDYTLPADYSLTILAGGSLSGSGKLSGGGTFKTENVTADMISGTEGLVYTGTDYTDQIKLEGNVTICGADFTADITGWTMSINPAEVKEAREYTVTLEKEGSTPITKTFTVAECTHTGLAYQPVAGGKHGGICTICGTEVSEEHKWEDGVCSVCNSKAVVQVEIDSATTYYGTIKDAWNAAKGHTATVTLLADAATDTNLEVESGSNITFEGGDKALTSHWDVIFWIKGGTLTIKSGTFSTTSEGQASVYVHSSGGELFVNDGTFEGAFGIWLDGGKATLNGGTFTGSEKAILIPPSDKLSDLLKNYGDTDPNVTHYAFFDEDNTPVTSGLDGCFLPSGTYTVQECNNIGEGICEYQQVDTTTHKMTCLACGFTGTMECTYDDNDKSVSNGDGTHTLTCAGCGSTKTEDCSGGTASYTEKAICAVCGGTYGEVLKDAGAPTGEISISTNKWNSFLNTIAFGLFFKKTEQVTITAQDQESGVASVSYYISDSELSEEGVKALTTEWTVVNAATVTFGISEDVSCVVYAKIADNQGNVTYISSDGMVFDGTLPSITGVTDRETYCTPQTITVKDDNLESVTVNGKEETLPDGEKTLSFTLDAASGTQTIKATDKAGNITTVTVYMEHRYGTEWKSDSESHWHECVCGDKSDTAAHTEDNGSVTKPATGIMTYRCSVCGYEMRTAEIKGRVIVRYVDESENEIETSITLTGIVGEDYETAEANIVGYTLKTSPANAKGKYTEEDITVTYVYQKNQVTEKTGKVIVRYVDESDKEIKASTALTGIVGADYETAEAEIEGYTLKTSPANAKGKYTEEDITVTFVYSKNTTPEYKKVSITSFKMSKASNSITTGQTVRMTATATGGGGELKYQFVVKLGNGKNQAVRKYSSDNSCQWIPTQSGKYTLYVYVKDSSTGKVVKKSIKNYYVKPALKIKSFTQSRKSGTAVVGDKVIVRVNATGGIGKKSYRYYYKLNGKKYILKENTTSKKVNWTPKKAGKYQLFIEVTDDMDNKITKKVNYIVVDKLKVKSLKAGVSSVKAGQEVKLSAAAAGGTKGYSYKFTYEYKNKSVTINNYSGSSSVMWTPKYKGKYKITVYVKDAKNRKATKTMTLNVK